MEQKMTASADAQSVPVLSSRELFVPTVSAQRKALLLGAPFPVQQPLPASVNTEKLTPATSTIQKTSTAPSAPLKPKTSLPAVLYTSSVSTSSVVVTSQSSVKDVGGSLSSLSLPASDRDSQQPVTQQSVETQRLSQSLPDTFSQPEIEGLCLPAR